MKDKKVVLITGGSDGLGKALAENLKGDCEVVILSHHEEKLKAVANELGVQYVVADISNYSEVEKAIEEVVSKCGKIDCLVNNAGVWIEGHIDDLSPEAIQKVININVTGTMFVTRAVVPMMKKRGEGKIINVISQGGLYGKANRSVYYGSKWALTGFTKCLQIDLTPLNINVSGFYPGLMNTNLFNIPGAKRDVSHSMAPDDVAETLGFIVRLPNNIVVSEMGVNPL